MRARLYRTMWIALVAVIAGAIIVIFATQSWEAAMASAVAGAIAVALLFDAAERADAAPATPATLSAPHAGPDEGELQAVIDALPNPMLVIANGAISRCNPAAFALLGSHILGKDVRLAVRHPAVIDILSGVHAEGEAGSVEIVGLGTAEQSWELRMVPLSGERELVSFVDQSGRQATERMRVDFVANASHELRTPLAGILGFVETLRDPVAGADAATRERFLSIMDGEARRMQRLVDDLMSLSRIEADKYRAPDQPVALPALAEEVAAIFRQSPRGGREMIVESAAAVPLVRGDHGQLSQLLHNLVSNAVKYGAPGTPVMIRLRGTAHGMVSICVVDQGDGIAPEHLPRLTERFYRVDSSRSRAMGGTGLGLAIVKHIVQRHRGHLQLESVLGEGTSVFVELPPFTAR